MKGLILILAFVPFAVISQTNELVVTGKINGLKENTKVVLTNGANGQQLTTAVVKADGSFALKGKMIEPSIWQVSFPGNTNALLDFFAGKNAVSITGSVNDLSKVVIKGNQMQDDYVAFKNQFVPYINELRARVDLINAEVNVAKRDSILRLHNTTKTNALTAAVQFVTNKPASPVSAFVLNVMAPVFNDIGEVESLYTGLQEQARKGNFARDLEKTIANTKIGTVGSTATNFTQNDVNGKPVSLSAFRGKFVLVDFWASWCGPCRRENPNVVSAYQKYKNKNFTVLGVSLDQSKPNWLQAIDTDNLTWTHVSDLQYWNNAVAQLYRVQSIPANILVDPNGKIVARNLYGSDLDKMLDRLLKSN